MTPAQDVASYRWPALTAPRCTRKLGELTCTGEHHPSHTYVGHSADDRGTRNEERG